MHAYDALMYFDEETSVQKREGFGAGWGRGG